MARKLYPGEDALGRQIKFGIDPAVPFATIVGIVPNLAVAPAAGEVTETMYVPLAQLPSRNVGIFAAATVDPLTLTNPMRKVVSDVDEDMAISDTNSLAAALWQRGWAFRVFGTLFMSFGVGALVLAGAGLYGVMAFGVRRRTQEIGVRMALGAARGSVLRMILWQGMWRVGLGIAIGLVPAWLLAGQMRALLTRVSQFDPLVFGLTILLLVLAGVAATIVPALRAASVDPLVALRHE
jgi:ABC-type antimicrobial peptide transport system permease subunit